MAKTKLGRGLATLLSPINQYIQHIETDRIQLSPPQQEEQGGLSHEDIEKRAENIQKSGFQSPISVSREKDYFLLCDDVCTYTAAQLLALPTIPVLIRPSAPISQNPIQRLLHEGSNNPIELAQTYNKIMSDFQLTQEGLSLEIKKSRSSIANTLRLLSLPFDIREDIRVGRLFAGHGIALLRLPFQEQRILYKEIRSKNLNIAQTMEIAKKRQLRINRKQELERLIETCSTLFQATCKVHSKGTGLNIQFTNREELLEFLRKQV